MTVLTVKEVAADLRVANLTVYKLIQKGKLKAFKIGNRIRINPEDLEKYKESESNEVMP